MQSKTELAALLDDLRWCFDTPANTVIELALFRLGVSEFYCNFLNDIDLHSVKSTITAAGITLDILLAVGVEGTHRQEHGTGQGANEGPLNWVPVADMVISFGGTGGEHTTGASPHSPQETTSRRRCPSHGTWTIRH